MVSRPGVGRTERDERERGRKQELRCTMYINQLVTTNVVIMY